MKKHIPNTITLFNLFCGCCAVASIFYGQFVQAFWFSIAGGVADYLDGLIARWLKVNSPLGKELDSMADMVSFGVVPGAIFYILLVKSLEGQDALPIELTLVATPAFLVSMFSGLRLAMFNIYTRQTENFIGLNTPATTMYTLGLLMVFHFNSYGLAEFVINPIFLGINILALSYLLVSEFSMFSFKFKNLKWEGNEKRFLFLGTAILSLIFLKEKEVVLPIMILIYVILAIFNRFFGK
ncbi:MAG: CDP-diacylglycerol--serine O-phosphatidyltransferase [Saprospiraceae bacterium]|jgi:CDP-diacylglycerol--serine O-phosphatidyltransferase